MSNQTVKPLPTNRKKNGLWVVVHDRSDASPSVWSGALGAANQATTDNVSYCAARLVKASARCRPSALSLAIHLPCLAPLLPSLPRKAYETKACEWMPGPARSRETRPLMGAGLVLSVLVAYEWDPTAAPKPIGPDRPGTTKTRNCYGC